MIGRTTSDKVLCDKVFTTAKNPKHNVYQCGLASMVYNFFDKNSAAMLPNTLDGTIKSKIISNQQSREKLEKLLIRKKVYSSFKDNIWSTDLANMQLISKYNEGIRFSSIFLVNMLGLFFWKKIKVLKLLTLFKKFEMNLIASKKIWIDKSSEFYNSSMVTKQ